MFDPTYEHWYNCHIHNSSGNRKERLLSGHGHAEKLFLQKVWYPLFHHFDHLYPEYETADYRDGGRFIDFAYIRSTVKLAIEIDGYGPHSSKVTRWQFADSLMRQNHLIIDGWRILRFSYDDLVERPRMCEQCLQQFMGKWGNLFNVADSYSGADELLEHEILRHAFLLERNIKPQDVCELLLVGKKRAYTLLRNMVNKGSLLHKDAEGQRKRTYIVNSQYITKKRLFM